MKNIFEEAWVVHGLDGLEWTVVEGSEFMRSLQIRDMVLRLHADWMKHYNQIPVWV